MLDLSAKLPAPVTAKAPGCENVTASYDGVEFSNINIEHGRILFSVSPAPAWQEVERRAKAKRDGSELPEDHPLTVSAMARRAEQIAINNISVDNLSADTREALDAFISKFTAEITAHTADFN